MKQSAIDHSLARTIQERLPSRLKISELHSRTDAGHVRGTVKIYCSSDGKSFLSDFEATVDASGTVTEIKLDGESIKTKFHEN